MNVRNFVSVLLLLFTGSLMATDDIPIIAVSANFATAIEKIAGHLTAKTGMKVRISTGASGTLVRQIKQGAPFELFLSADEAFAERLYHEGLALNAGSVYAIGRMALYIPKDSALSTATEPEYIIRKLRDDPAQRVAIANPELAPYGLAAKEILQRFSAWNGLQERLIMGENVGQTAQFALTGTIDVAFIPYSLAISENMRSAGTFHLIPAKWHTPLKQRMVLLRDAGTTARALYDFLLGDTAQQIIIEHGYAVPDDN